MKRLASFVLLALLFGISPAAINQVSAQSPQPGDYIVTESYSNLRECYLGVLSKITPNGLKTPIYSGSNFCPRGVAIDSEGNYIVTEPNFPSLVRA